MPNRRKRRFPEHSNPDSDASSDRTERTFVSASTSPHVVPSTTVVASSAVTASADDKKAHILHLISLMPIISRAMLGSIEQQAAKIGKLMSEIDRLVSANHKNLLELSFYEDSTKNGSASDVGHLQHFVSELDEPSTSSASSSLSSTPTSNLSSTPPPTFSDEQDFNLDAATSMATLPLQFEASSQRETIAGSTEYIRRYIADLEIALNFTLELAQQGISKAEYIDTLTEYKINLQEANSKIAELDIIICDLKQRLEQETTVNAANLQKILTLCNQNAILRDSLAKIKLNFHVYSDTHNSDLEIVIRLVSGLELTEENKDYLKKRNLEGLPTIIDIKSLSAEQLDRILSVLHSKDHTYRLEKGLFSQGETIKAQQDTLQAKDEHIAAQQAALQVKDEHIAAQQAALQVKDEHIAAQQAALQAKDAEINALKAALSRINAQQTGKAFTPGFVHTSSYSSATLITVPSNAHSEHDANSSSSMFQTYDSKRVLQP
jgi:hypothetical protein